MDYPLAKNRHAWLQVAEGAVELNGQPLVAGDGAALSDERALQLRGESAARIVLFQLA